MVQLHGEFLHRKHGVVGDRSVDDIERKGIDSNEDDYFVIGPSNERFAHSIAYRNRLKHRIHSQYPSLKDTSSQSGPSAQQTTCFKKTHVQDTAASRRNEAVQTEGPRTALEMEIHRIREDLERRKRGLRQETKNKDNREKREQQEDKTQTPSSAMRQIQSERHAQRPKTSKMTADVTMNQSMPKPMRRQQSIGARTHRRLSEYQWAYRIPEKSYYIKPSRSVEDIPDQSKGYLRPRTAVIDYETEYRHEYKPFKYVTEENLKSTCLMNEAGINVVPLPRPRSAIVFKRWSQEPDTRQEGRSAHTPHEEKRENRKTLRRRHLSESNAKYRDYSDPKRIARWLREFAELRQQAESYCSRERGSHFTRDHLAQLDSTYVKYWDEVNSERYTENCTTKRTTLPNSQTGKINDINNNSMPLNTYQGPGIIDARRNMFDSHNIEQVMKKNEQWSTSSIATDDLTESTGSQSKKDMREWAKREPNPQRGDCAQNGDLVLSERPATSTNILCPKEPEDENAECMPNEKTRLEKKTRYHAGAHCGSIGVLSPDAARSMNSSATIASETLEKARRQHERVFREYADEQKPCYSPLNYVNNVCSTNRQAWQ